MFFGLRNCVCIRSSLCVCTNTYMYITMMVHQCNSCIFLITAFVYTTTTASSLYLMRPMMAAAAAAASDAMLHAFDSKCRPQSQQQKSCSYTCVCICMFGLPLYGFHFGYCFQLDLLHSMREVVVDCNVLAPCVHMLDFVCNGVFVVRIYWVKHTMIRNLLLYTI